jgi:hypothetical protein
LAWKKIDDALAEIENIAEKEASARSSIDKQMVKGKPGIAIGDQIRAGRLHNQGSKLVTELNAEIKRLASELQPLIDGGNQEAACLKEILEDMAESYLSYYSSFDLMIRPPRRIYLPAREIIQALMK